jgi:sodium/potassium/calcium exchanger 6
LDIVAAPSVLLLTVTVPVVEPAQPESADQKDSSGPVPVVVEPADDREGTAPPVRLPDDSPVAQAVDHQSSQGQGTAGPNGSIQHNRERLDSELPAVRPSGQSSSPPKEWSRWLVSLQLFTGPFFIVLIGWTATDPDMNARNILIPSLSSLLFSLLCFACLIISTRHNHSTQPPGPWRPVLSLLGFVVAVSWIASVATEVVSLLKTIGVILNISDSLLGLTVFAVGNSLGDLVADITVARLGYPVMALSACFGGPMLNILLGIGLGGLYMTLNPRASNGPGDGHGDGLYQIAISKVLVISSASLFVTLLGLLIVIPLNHWTMDRKIGWALICLWAVSTLSNVIVEIVS